MNQRISLVVASLLSVLLFSIHVTDDIVRGFDAWGPQSLFGVLILVVWLSGTMLPARRAGLIIMLLGGLLAAAMPVIHMRTQAAKSPGGFLFIWTLFALGASGGLAFVLAAGGLWKSRARRAGAS